MTSYSHLTDFFILQLGVYFFIPLRHPNGRDSSIGVSDYLRYLLLQSTTDIHFLPIRVPIPSERERITIHLSDQRSNFLI